MSKKVRFISVLPTTKKVIEKMNSRTPISQAWPAYGHDSYTYTLKQWAEKHTVWTLYPYRGLCRGKTWKCKDGVLECWCHHGPNQYITHSNKKQSCGTRALNRFSYIGFRIRSICQSPRESFGAMLKSWASLYTKKRKNSDITEWDLYHVSSVKRTKSKTS